MSYFKISVGILLVLATSRFIPHPPNFTSLIALSFYVPAFFGLKYIWIVFIAYFITDIILGLHSTLLFTWGSVVLIGFISKYLNQSVKYRLFGALFASLLFFVITNFGVWLLGMYDYSFKGLLESYIMAIPFYKNTILSTLIYSLIIETIFKFYTLKTSEKSFLK
jgi:hypothetical protein